MKLFKLTIMFLLEVVKSPLLKIHQWYQNIDNQYFDTIGVKKI
jgi:hypothetical protein